MTEQHTEVGLSKRKRRLQWSNINVQKVVVTLTFLFVPLFLLILFTYLPFFKMVQFSFYDMKYIGERKFVGLENYVNVFTRDDCFNALKLSLYYMVGSVVQLALALLFATILSFNPKGGSFFRGALYFPSLVCGIAVGFIFKYLNPDLQTGHRHGITNLYIYPNPTSTIVFIFRLIFGWFSKKA